MSEQPPPTSTLEYWIERLSQRVEAESRRLDLIESRVVPLLERIAVALENGAFAHASSPARDDGRSSAASRVREAIKVGDWGEAEAIIADLPDTDPLSTRLAEQLSQARASTLDDLRGRLEAARQVNDPEAAIGIRDQMAPLLDSEGLRQADQVLVKWLMGLIQRRLRGGTIRADVPQLAAMISEKFGGTSEGASLRAALPTLRRSAGLCPRCGEPYVGEEDTCPKCVVETAPRVEFVADDRELDDESSTEDVEPLDLNNERNWESA